MEKDYEVLIRGYSADVITREIVKEIISKIDIEKLKNEVRNRVVSELKDDITKSQQVQIAIRSSIEKADVNINARINKAINFKIAEIERFSLENLSFKIEK